MRDNRFGFFVLTEYQLLCVTEFVWNNIEESRNHSTLFLSKSVSRFNEIVLQLGKCKIFSEIVLVDRIGLNQSRIARKIQSMGRVLNSNAFGKYINGKNNRRDSVKFSTIVVASGSIEFEMFRNYYRHENLYYIEDGVGSYIGGAKKGNISKSRKFIQTILGRDEHIAKMYLHMPELCKHKEAEQLCAIPDNRRDDFWRFVREVFNTKQYEKLYKERDAIYVEQPMIGWGQASAELDKKIQKLCADSFGQSICIRNHPRDRGKKSVIARSDDRPLLWELICYTEIKDSNLLIGFYSTAQITPKILFDIEPIVIFLYKLYPIPAELEQKMNETVLLLSNAYCDASRIYVPDNVDKFLQILNEFKICNYSR